MVEGVGDHGCEYMTGGNVIVLGETGKNFAAGMSGGISYVFDENKKFESKCNSSMVALENVSDTEEKFWLRKWITLHQENTGSLRAGQLLENWNKTVRKFVKVMPHEYRAVLETLKNKAA